MTDSTTPPARVTPIQADREALQKVAYMIANMHVLAIGASVTSLDQRTRLVDMLRRAIIAEVSALFFNRSLAALSEREQAVREALQEVRAKIVPEDGHDPVSAWDSGRYSAFRECEKILLSTLAAPKAEDHPVHKFFTETDADAPQSIFNHVGEVVLSLCKVCGQAEGDLAPSCPGRAALADGERLREALEFIGGHDAAANGLSGFAFELVETLTSAARAALSEPHPSAGEDEDCDALTGCADDWTFANVPEEAARAALERWLALPDDVRNGERPFIHGFNEGWQEALAHPAHALADDDIETLLRDIEAMGDWEERHDEILERWRQRRGEAGMDGWRWWWRPDGDDRYWTDHDTREQAIQAGIDDADSHAYGEDIEIIEARCWADDIDVENARFADTRNHERLSRSLLATEGR